MDFMENNADNSSDKAKTKITFQRPQIQNTNYRIPPGIYDNLSVEEKNMISALAENTDTDENTNAEDRGELSEEEKMDLIEKQALLRLKEYEYAQSKLNARNKRNASSQRSIRILIWPLILIVFFLIFYAVMKLFSQIF